MKLSFEDIKKLFSFDFSNGGCTEILFSVEDHPSYQQSWMGKMFDKNKDKEVYWLGLTEDGTQAHEYCSFEDMASDKDFQGKSLREIWSFVDIKSIDACDPEDRVKMYLDYF